MNSEIDFTAMKSKTAEYYQVPQTMMAEETYSREMRPLKAVSDNYEKTILTMDRFGLGNDNGINIVNVIDWLLE
jgi:predicted AAA+ superfamily ATPase